MCVDRQSACTWVWEGGRRFNEGGGFNVQLRWLYRAKCGAGRSISILCVCRTCMCSKVMDACLMDGS